MFVVGFFSAAYVGFSKLWLLYHGQNHPGDRQPWFYITLTMMILGVQFLMAGFVGEMIVKSRSRVPDFYLDRTLGKDEQLKKEG